MKTAENIRLLADRIRDIFREGILIDPKTFDFIDSTFLHPSPQALKEILADESLDEREMLLDLIFFPDFSFQSRLEAFLQENLFNKPDESALIEALRDPPLETGLPWGNPEEVIPVRMPAELISGFVERLRICRRMDPEIYRCVDATCSDGISISVRLRNSRLAFTSREIEFVGKFLRRFPDGGPGFQAMLKWMLNFLETCQAETEYFVALMDRKKRLLKEVSRHSRLEQQLVSGNFESLILGGGRFHHLDRQAALEEIGWIDSTALALYNRTESWNPVGKTDFEFTPEDFNG